MPKVKVDNDLYDKVKRFAEIAGYSSADEFITHVLEKELSSIDDTASEEEVKNRLKGLGYLS
jgi:metal-responsive CopG/Arc/MetJ family transcriptional regulator